MELKIIKADEDLTHLALSGRLDVVGEREVGVRFKAYTAARKKSALIDLSGVTFLASLGIRMLFLSAKSLAGAGERMVVLNPQPLVEETLRTAGLTELMPIAQSVDEALEILGRSAA